MFDVPECTATQMKNTTWKTTLTSLAVLAAGAVAQQAEAFDIRITDLEMMTRNASGSWIVGTPKIGEAYAVRVKYSITGPMNFVPKLKLKMGEIETVHSLANSTGNYAPIIQRTMNLDGSIPVVATLDLLGHTESTGSPRDNQKVISFSPVPPTSALEFYAPRRLSVNQWVSGYLNSAGSTNLVRMMAGIPSTDGWQIHEGSNGWASTPYGMNISLTSEIANEGFQRVFQWKKGSPIQLGSWYRISTQSTVTVRNTRVNMDKLKQITWAQIDALQGINVFKYYTKPDAVNNSNDPKIAAFVTGVLGGNYRQNWKPYDAARRVYRAILARCSYKAPSPSHTATEMLDNKEGDCGAYSLLITACFRYMGIPARNACGAWVGTDAGHCWNEFWMPGAGWVLSDGSAGESESPKGDYAAFFGNIRDMNLRYASMRGNEFTADGWKVNWLQGPQFYSAGSAKFINWMGQTTVVEVP